MFNNKNRQLNNNFIHFFQKMNKGAPGVKNYADNANFVAFGGPQIQVESKRGHIHMERDDRRQTKDYTRGEELQKGNGEDFSLKTGEARNFQNGIVGYSLMNANNPRMMEEEPIPLKMQRQPINQDPDLQNRGPALKEKKERVSIPLKQANDDVYSKMPTFLDAQSKFSSFRLLRI